jgi:predicted DsbA family dithiol-disulfide isomerase
VTPVRLVVHSDYLCPWCYVAAHRLERAAREEGGVELVWRAFLLRPHPAPREREAFVRYTRSWQRPAAEPDAPVLRPWPEVGDEGPPSHSLPPHLVARAAARQGPEAFAALHARLLRAYFEEARDITADTTLRALWAEAGLPADGFEASREPGLRQEVLAEHRRALDLGITGVPAVQPEGHDAFVLGAQPLATYRRWIARLRAGVLERAADAAGG